MAPLPFSTNPTPMRTLTFSLLLLLSLSFASQTFAATLVSDYTNRLKRNETKILAPLTLTAEKAGEITAKNGLNLLLDPTVYILWDSATPLQASGTAVDKGRIAASIVPEYQKNYTLLHIPVLADFESGESVTLSGISMRAYNRVFSKRFLGIDLTGDNVADTEDINSYVVEDVEVTDHTPPYPPAQFTAQVNDARTQVTLTWKNPPDYDFIGDDIERTLTRSIQTPGNASQSTSTTNTLTLITSTTDPTYLDKDIKIGDQITYSIFSKDIRNNSDPVKISITIPPINVIPESTSPASGGQPPSQTSPSNEEGGQEPGEEGVNPSATTSSPEPVEGRLYNYYKIRHQIKCRAGMTADDGCRWAKIDLLYAQAKLDKQDVQATLTSQDLKIIAIRLPWSQKRYENNCSSETTPKSYCHSLNQAIQHANYFLEN